MKAVILCGGQGSRIRDVSEILPKPMLPIGPFPILWHIMRIFRAHGVREFVLCLGYKGWAIKEFFLNYRAMVADFTLSLAGDTAIEYHNVPEVMDWRVTFVETGDEAQTGARLFHCRRYLEGEERFLLTYGDSVADLDVTRLLENHRTAGRIAMFSGVHPPARFGEYEADGNRVTAFQEKPNISAGRINGGFMAFDNKRIWDHLRPGDDLILEGEVMKTLTREHELAVYEHDGYWQCMDTPREYHMLNRLWNEGDAPWKIW